MSSLAWGALTQKPLNACGTSFPRPVPQRCSSRGEKGTGGVGPWAAGGMSGVLVNPLELVMIQQQKFGGGVPVTSARLYSVRRCKLTHSVLQHCCTRANLPHPSSWPDTRSLTVCS